MSTSNGELPRCAARICTPRVFIGPRLIADKHARWPYGIPSKRSQGRCGPPISGLAGAATQFGKSLLAVLVVLWPLAAGLAGLVPILGLDQAAPWPVGLGAATSGTAFRLVTLNLSYRNETIDRVDAFIRHEAPHVVALQEVANRTRAAVD